MACGLRSSTLLSIVSIAWTLAASACQSSPVAAPELSQPTVPEPDWTAMGRFPHADHTAMPCTDCHPLAAVRGGRRVQPGSDDHAPCDRAGCHREAFLSHPSSLCLICHQSVEPTAAGASPLRPYPPQRGLRALASQFSHAQHLDYAAMDEAVGFHVSCGDCHQQSAGGAVGTGTGTGTVEDVAQMMALPGHRECGRCHAAEAALPGVVAMSDCQTCHRPRLPVPARARRMITGDLRFSHERHRTDVAGDHILCSTCHAKGPNDGDGVAPRNAAQPRAVDDALASPNTAICVACHDDEARAPARVRIAACTTCHSTIDSGLRPRSHLPVRARPLDHTLAFRTDHGEPAAADPQRCARCHVIMSTAPRDVCDECHQVMQPQDHRLAWREFDHGPAAFVDSDRCATCHGTPFCVDCHAQMPRSHVPRAAFVMGGHALPASVNLRACLVCHDVERDCNRAGCHSGLSQLMRGMRWR